MNNSNAQWIFKDGLSSVSCTSFPYAYRMMYNTLKKGVESGRKYEDMMQDLRIISPQKDQHGDPRRYTYLAATELAKASDLLNSTGEINSKVFRKNR